MYVHLKYTDALLAFGICEKLSCFAGLLPGWLGGIKLMTLGCVASSGCGLATRSSCLLQITNLYKFSLANSNSSTSYLKYVKLIAIVLYELGQITCYI